MKMLFALAAVAMSLRPFDAGSDPPPPNVVVIVTDDQRWDTLSYMPHVQTLAQAGVLFTNAFASAAVCEPSRTSMLTGLYNHHLNADLGYPNPAKGFHDSSRDQSTLATWLHAAGYVTGLVGKYLNGNDQLAPTIPPGWDDWFTFVTVGYWNWSVNDRGTVASRTDYATDALAARAVTFIRQHAAQPFFLWLAPFAPHSTKETATTAPIPPPRYAHTFDALPPFAAPNVPEVDRTDKPGWLQAVPPTTTALLEAHRQGELGSILAVDDAVGVVVQALTTAGVLDHTAIFVLSDNGMMWNEHGFQNKLVGYEPSIRIPWLVVAPWLNATVREEPRIVLNVDMAPTVMDLVGLALPSPVNGVSLVPLLKNQPPAAWREDCLLEFLTPVFPVLPSYGGVRTTRWKYLATDEWRAQPEPAFEELYDLYADPYELDNLLVTNPNDPMVQSELLTLRARLAALRAE